MEFIIGAIIFVMVICVLTATKGTLGGLANIVFWLIRAAGVLFAIILVIVFVLDIFI